MKKIIITFTTLLMILVFASINVYGAVDPTVKFDNKIEVKKDQNEVSFEIKINNQDPYAGAEFGVQCGENIKIKDVTYNINTSKTGVTEGQGIHWFSFFSGKNDINGEVIATVTLECLGEKNTSIVLDNVSIYTKNNQAIDTYRINNRDEISINREGAQNDIEELEPPKELEEANKNANNNSTNKPGNNQNNSNGDGSNNDLDSSLNNSSSNSGNGGSGNSSNGAAGNENNTVLGQSPEQINNIVVILLIISLSVNLALGFLYFKKVKAIKIK